MRTVAAVASFLAASAAFADPAPGAQKPLAVPSTAAARPAPPAPPPPLAPLDMATVPEACKPLAQQALARTLTAAPARISLAGCIADKALAPLELCDCGDSIRAADAAVAPAIAILDSVIDAGEPTNRVIAEHAEGKLYLGLVTRLRATLPRPGAGAADTEVALHDARKQTLEVQLAPWHEAAMAAFQHVVDAAKSNPALARNAAAAAAIRESQQQLAAEVASR